MLRYKSIILVVFFSLVFLILGNGFVLADEYLEGSTFSELTLKSIDREIPNVDMYSYNESVYMDFYYISPHASVNYFDYSDREEEYNINGKKYDNLLKFEEDLKTEYNLIMLRLKINDNDTNFSLYEFRNSFSLIIEDEKYDLIDYYDYKHSGSASAVFGTTSYYGRFNSYTLYGYLMFPKVNLEGIKKIKLKSNYFEEDIDLIWNLEKINMLIDVMAN